jgi:hypothetical protein
MPTCSDIISLWPSAEHFAADIGLRYASYGRVMKMRGRIPAKYWDRTVEAAARRGIRLDRNDIAQAHAHPDPEPERAAL